MHQTDAAIHRLHQTSEGRECPQLPPFGKGLSQMQDGQPAYGERQLEKPRSPRGQPTSSQVGLSESWPGRVMPLAGQQPALPCYPSLSQGELSPVAPPYIRAPPNHTSFHLLHSLRSTRLSEGSALGGHLWPRPPAAKSSQSSQGAVCSAAVTMKGAGGVSNDMGKAPWVPVLLNSCCSNV